jgi:pSer/pThr/pTyr-binding forkhead associated (FHA) protein
VTAQDLLDALEKARNESNLDYVALWALSKYLHGAWTNSLARDLRAYDLGKALSDFFVDLSIHRLPEKVTNQTLQIEQHLLEFYGVTGGGLSQFWTRCMEIWGITLEPYPAYASEVNKYFDLLLQSSLQGKRSNIASAQIKPPVESFEEVREAPAPAPTNDGFAPEIHSVPPVSSAPIAYGSPFESPASVAASQIKKPEQADFTVPAVNETGPVTPDLIPTPEDEPEPLPKNAYLVLQGTRVIPLNQPFIKIGRQLDNNIILEDPRVSRSHAQIKLVNDRFVIFDMNSTGGTFVNGRPTSQSVLYPGDAVSFAGVVFIFSQEMSARPANLKIFELGSPFAADRPAAVIHQEEIWAAKKIRPNDLPDLPETGPFE